MSATQQRKGILLAPHGSRYRPNLLHDLPGIDWRELPSVGGDEDLALFLIEADRGISQDDVADFQRIREMQIPTLIMVASLIPTQGEDRWDFDDIVLLAHRILEPVITPFLVLHDDHGIPSGLYDLARDVVIDQSSVKAIEHPADDALRELTADFKAEFLEEDFRDEDFTSGLRVIALPYLPERGVGIEEAKRFITTLLPVRP